MTMLSDEELAAIKARAAMATPGEWSARTAPSDDSGETHAEYMANSLCGRDPNLHVVIAPSVEDEFAYFVTAVTGDGPTSAANAGFIAHAPADVAGLLAHIDALTAQRDRARDIAVSLEQELAEVQAIPQRWVMGSGGPQPWSEMDPDPGADQVIAEFDAAAKAARLGAWSAPDGSHGVSASGPWKASEDSA